MLASLCHAQPDITQARAAYCAVVPWALSKENHMLIGFARNLIAATLVLSFATPAFAGPRIITPGLLPPATGFLTCRVVNASATKTIEIESNIYDFNGTVVAGPSVGQVLPNRSISLSTGDNDARHCVVEVTKGGKRNARVSLYVTNGGIILTAVNGQ